MYPWASSRDDQCAEHAHKDSKFPLVFHGCCWGEFLFGDRIGGDVNPRPQSTSIPLWSEHYHWHIRCVSDCVLLQPRCVCACPCNYRNLRSVFPPLCLTLPPLCQPGNPGSQVTNLNHIPSLPPFFSELLINCMPSVHWIPTLLDVLPMLPACLCLSCILFCHNSTKAAAKVMMPLLWGKYSLWLWKCLILLLCEGNNL